MKTIVIIGAGQLGSRHLQGIAKSNFDMAIEVVDPSEKSLEIAEQRYKEVAGNEFIKKVSFYMSVNDLSNTIDLAIVATSSDIRAKVINELINKKTVKNLVLEKVLFQSIDDYYKIETLLKKANIKCWVNHPRRMFPYYKELKLLLKGANQISYSFQGGSWGLGCNALHFIDHLSYLTDSVDLLIDNELLNNKIYSSKRDGFIEFNGMLTGKISNNLFSLYCNENPMPSTFTISSDKVVVKIDEAKGEVCIATKEQGWEWKVFNEKIVYFQSELSNVLVEDILVNKKCYLPTYSVAMKLHIPFIECLLNHMKNTTGTQNEVCPIT